MSAINYFVSSEVKFDLVYFKMLQDCRQVLKTPGRSQWPDPGTRRMIFSLGERRELPEVMRNGCGSRHHSALNAGAGD